MPHLLASTIHCSVSAAPCAGRARARDAAQQVAAGEAEEVSGKQTLSSRGCGAQEALNIGGPSFLQL